MSAYEAQRAANIARNAELLSSLGIQYAPVKPAATPSKPRPASKKRKAAPATPREPTRKSARLTTVEGGYTEPSGIDPEPDEPRGWLRQMPAVEIPDMDEVEYDPTFVAPAPTRDADGTLRFEKGYDHFTPNLVPRQIFKQGAFGGTAFRPFFSQIAKRHIAADYDEFDSLADLDAALVTSEEYDSSRNCYGVKAGQSLEDWEKSGWIRAPDFRGWIQWYCRFYAGRRSSDDDRQIRRWLGVCGARGRFKRSLVKKIASQGGDFDDAAIAPVLRQTLHHWAYRLTAADYAANLA